MTAQRCFLRTYPTVLPLLRTIAPFIVPIAFTITLTIAPQALIAQVASQVSSLPSLEADFVPNTIVVKLAPNSALLHIWQQQGRAGELSLLRGLLGAHSTAAYIDDGLLEAVQRALRGTSEDPPERLTDGIARLCVVRLQSANAHNVERLAAKLAARARTLGLEYAEPMNVQRLANDSAADVAATPPNDPLVGQQWHLPRIRAFEAWRELARTKTDSSALAVAVIDTGVDYEHEDLSGLIWTNPGESGTDAQGRDRRTNGVDDDRNGKVDDWRGWDFRGADGATPDNNPLPGNNHGTHVAGLLAARINNGIGGAGATPFVRILPIKISRDNPSDEKVANGFEAMLYAASLGVRIINCSWRVTTPLQAERELTAMVVRMGALVVAAGGNDGREAAVYPAAYQGVVSVSATASDDRRGGFANLDASVDIAAPGVSLYSTFPESRYGFKSGTSMATPLVAAAAALVQMRFPRFTAEQITAQLKATSDNVDALNTDAIGRMGFGRVNALRAVRDSQAVFVECSSLRVQDANGNGRLESGEQVELQLTLRNLLNAARNLRVQPSLSRIALASGAIGTLPSDPMLLTPMLNAGNFQSLEERTLSERVRLRLPELQGENFLLTVTLNIRTAEGVLCGREQVTLTLSPSFVTMAANDLTVSVSNTGNIGFADPPRNRLGVGFLYKGGDNLLFEGALMVASGRDSVSTVARGLFGRSDRHFVNTAPILAEHNTDYFTTSTAFSDVNLANRAGVRVEQTVYQYQTAQARSMLVCSYSITNASERDFSGIYAGLFCDWDIGEDYTKNVVQFDASSQMAIFENVIDMAQPKVGMALLTPQRLNFYALDADADTSTGNITLDDGFDAAKKWRTLSSGIGRRESLVSDVTAVMGAGPIRLPRGQTTIVSLALLVAPSKQELRESLQASRNLASGSLSLAPQPAQDAVLLRYEVSKRQRVRVELYSLLGELLAVVQDAEVSAGTQQIALNLTPYAAGLYGVRLRSEDRTEALRLVIAR